MKKILILGSTGMLGNGVTSAFLRNKDEYSIDITSRPATIFKDGITMGSEKKPVIISMGMGGDKKQIMKIFSKNKTIFCYCISEYPTSLEKINWKEAEKYDGFSDHTFGIIAPVIFAVIKKQQKEQL